MTKIDKQRRARSRKMKKASRKATPPVAYEIDQEEQERLLDLIQKQFAESRDPKKRTRAYAHELLIKAKYGVKIENGKIKFFSSCPKDFYARLGMFSGDPDWWARQRGNPEHIRVIGTSDQYRALIKQELGLGSNDSLQRAMPSQAMVAEFERKYGNLIDKRLADLISANPHLDDPHYRPLARNYIMVQLYQELKIQEALLSGNRVGAVEKHMREIAGAIKDLANLLGISASQNKDRTQGGSVAELVELAEKLYPYYVVVEDNLIKEELVVLFKRWQRGDISDAELKLVTAQAYGKALTPGELETMLMQEGILADGGTVIPGALDGLKDLDWLEGVLKKLAEIEKP